MPTIREFMAMNPFMTFLVTRKTSPMGKVEPRGTEPLRDGSLPSWATIPSSNARPELGSTYAFLGIRTLPTTEHVLFLDPATTHRPQDRWQLVRAGTQGGCLSR